MSAEDFAALVARMKAQVASGRPRWEVCGCEDCAETAAAYRLLSIVGHLDVTQETAYGQTIRLSTPVRVF